MKSNQELINEAAAAIKILKKEAGKTNLQKAIEEELGRELEEFEAVFFKNGKPTVGFRPGVPYYTLQCSVCKNRLFTVEPKAC